MPWSEEDVRDIIEHLDPMAVLWLLIMHRGDDATGVHVGTGKAKNAVKLYSKVQAYAKNHGINPPPDEKKIKQGYRTLLRTPIPHPDLGTKTVIKGDKIDYLKLTGVGQRLATRIHTEPEIKKLAKSEAGLDVNAESEPSWPEEYDSEDANIILTPTENVSNLEQPFELPTRAEFECPICDESLCHKYTFEYPTDAWSEYEVKRCEGCGEKLRHKVGYPYSTIDRVRE